MKQTIPFDRPRFAFLLPFELGMHSYNDMGATIQAARKAEGESTHEVTVSFQAVVGDLNKVFDMVDPNVYDSRVFCLQTNDFVFMTSLCGLFLFAAGA